MQRKGMVITLKSTQVTEYKCLHAAVWPEVLIKLKLSNIRNYSIFLKEPENLLFSYFEYSGNNYDIDMNTLAQDPTIQAWWDLCMPCQQPLESAEKDEWWSTMEEVFYHD